MKKVILYILILTTCITTDAMQTPPCTQFKQLRTFLGALLTGYCTYTILYHYLKNAAAPLNAHSSAQKSKHLKPATIYAFYNYALQNNDSTAPLPEIIDSVTAKFKYTQFLKTAITYYTTSAKAQSDLSLIAQKLDHTVSLPLLLQASPLPVTVMDNLIAVGSKYPNPEQYLDENLTNKSNDACKAFLLKAGHLLEQWYKKNGLPGYVDIFFTIKNIHTIITLKDNPFIYFSDICKQSQINAFDEVNNFKLLLEQHSIITCKNTCLCAIILLTQTPFWKAETNLVKKLQLLRNALKERIEQFLPYENDDSNDFEKNFDEIMEQFSGLELRGKNFRAKKPESPKPSETTKVVWTEI